MEIKQYKDRDEKELKEMWDSIGFWLSLTEEERIEQNLPIRQKEVYESYGIPESTFYWQLQQEDFMKRVVRIGLVRAKKSLPLILKALEKNAIDGKEKSIELFFKFVGELAEKIDHTTKGEAIKGFNYIVPNDTDIETDPETAPSVAEAPGQ